MQCCSHGHMETAEGKYVSEMPACLLLGMQDLKLSCGKTPKECLANWVLSPYTHFILQKIAMSYII